jgi:hypothetical protein
LFTAALTQQHAAFDATIDTHAELRQIAFDDAVAVAATAAISNVYISSVGIVSEGVDVVLTLNEVSQGNFAASVGLLPFISGPIVNNTYRCILRTLDGTTIIRKVGEVFEHFPGLGWVYQRRMEIRFGQPDADGLATIVLGTGQRTVPPNDAIHAAKCEEIAFQWAGQPGFEYVVMNRSIHTCTGLQGLGGVADLRPDVFGVLRGTDGQPVFYIRELRSPSQSRPELEAKLLQIRDALRNLGYLPHQIDTNVIDLP